MSLTAFRFRNVALVAGGAAVAAATVAWLLRRAAESRETREHRPPAIAEGKRHRLPLPHWSRFEPEPERLPQVSARPSVRHEGPSSPDDYDALSPEDLGAAFLAGATDTALDEPPSSIAELQGFRIFEREEPADDSSDDESGDAVATIDDPLGRAR
ncbi:MAG TPA: hypothetical protein VEX18_12630 [Polyangiaceae bacterium]|nr:hypothetical protein [Polyangiaceae bacterium]